jgi:hypothetical protein
MKRIMAQQSFSGGINSLMFDTKLAENEYKIGFNLRNRYDSLSPIKGHKQIYAPSGKKQGLYPFGDFLILFCDGKMYYKHINFDTWNLVNGVNLSKDVDYVYMMLVPISTTNYARYSKGSVLDGVSFSGQAFGNVPGAVIQDGVNQPYFVDTARNVFVIRKFSEWSQSFREYVPIGTIMEFWNGMLLVSDGDQIFRSVTGRPLDFVVAVDQNGDKIGDAGYTSFGVGGSPIKAMKVLPNGSLFVAAADSCFLVDIDRSPTAQTIFGEPSFIRKFLFKSSVVNNFSVVDILGDTVFIENEGIRSFNSVMQTQNEGRNSVFSAKISRIFEGILQPKNVCATVFNNFAIFSVETIYGRKFVVYDTLLNCFCSIDDGLAIKQFAKIDTDVTRLFGIDDSNVYELYSGDKLKAKVITRGYAGESRANSVKILFSDFAEVKVDDVSSRGKEVVVRLFNELKHVTGFTIEWSGGDLIQLSAEVEETTPASPFLNSENLR